MLQIKFDWIRVPEKKTLSTPKLSKPDMGPQSSPNARAAVSHGRHLGHAWCRKVLLHDLGSVRLRTQTNRAGLLFADVGPHFMRS